VKERTLTATDKRAIVERLYAAWLGVPRQRLGQLIVNAAQGHCVAPLFYSEDKALIEGIEKFVQLNSRSPR